MIILEAIFLVNGMSIRHLVHGQVRQADSRNYRLSHLGAAPAPPTLRGAGRVRRAQTGGRVHLAGAAESSRARSLSHRPRYTAVICGRSCPSSRLASNGILRALPGREHPRNRTAGSDRSVAVGRGDPRSGRDTGNPPSAFSLGRSLSHQRCSLGVTFSTARTCSTVKSLTSN
jgi:hypothetical protein